MSKPNVSADRHSCDLAHERKLAKERKVNARRIAKGEPPKATCEVCKRRAAFAVQRFYVRIGQTFTPGYITRRTCAKCCDTPVVSDRYAMPRLVTVEYLDPDNVTVGDDNAMSAAIAKFAPRIGG